jgi:hypothetical protein
MLLAYLLNVLQQLIFPECEAEMSFWLDSRIHFFGVVIFNNLLFVDCQHIGFGINKFWN